MALHDKIRWLLYRVSAMTPAELGHRSLQFARMALRQGASALRPDGHAWRRAGHSSMFDFMRRPERMLDALPLDTADSGGELLLADHITVYGRRVTWRADQAFWHTDPLSGRTWPRINSHRVDYRPGNPVGDARSIWELNRLQHFHALALAAEQNPACRSRAAARITTQLLSWQQANPPGIGINQTVAMEQALRVICLCHVFDLMRDVLAEEARQAITDIVLHHAEEIIGDLSLYSSAGNHTLAEATGLLYAGTLFPEHGRAARWTATARHLLETESARQVRIDGGPLEQTTWYLLFITDLMGLAQLRLKAAGLPALPAMDAALARARTFLNTLATGPDDLPRIGDADDGYVLSPRLRLSWSQARLAAPAQHTFPASGVTAVAFGQRDQLLFLHKDLGMPPNYGHGHCDALSVVLRREGAPLLLDPGTAIYGSDAPDVRRWFRGVEAHNTLAVDGRDPAHQTGAFMWRNPYHCRLALSILGDDETVLLASHDGYRDMGLVHWRGVVYRRTGLLAVWDMVLGPGQPRPCRLNWHIGTQSIEPAGRRGVSLQLDNGTRFAMRTSTGADLDDGMPLEPEPDWYSPRYAELHPCLRLKASLPPAPRIETLTLLMPGTLRAADAALHRTINTFRSHTVMPA